MDELACPAAPASSCSSPSPVASFFSSSAVNHQQELDLVSCEVLEQWLAASDDCLDLDEPQDYCAAWGDGGEGKGQLSGGQPPAPAPKRRGRKPGPRTNGPAITHVEAERQRRDKLNRRFCDLRAAVPTVSRMDRASLLTDAAAYIAELRGRVEQLEAQAKARQASGVTTVAAAAAHSLGLGLGLGEKLECGWSGRRRRRCA